MLLYRSGLEQSWTTPTVNHHLTIHLLGDEHQAETVAYFSARPIETVYMRGLIRDNGIYNAQNRGHFYACRDRRGTIKGIALIGNAILIDSECDEATAALASFARHFPLPRLVRGERQLIERFWRDYAGAASFPYTFKGEHLLLQRSVAQAFEAVPQLRTATLGDLHLLMEINVEILSKGAGGSPLERDPAGFRRRLAGRIERGRVWLWREGERLIFKTDVLAETAQAIYLEGVYVAPDERGKGVGLRCLSQMARNLLKSAATVCLTVDEDNYGAQALYRKAGFELHCEHATIFLHEAQQAKIA